MVHHHHLPILTAGVTPVQWEPPIDGGLGILLAMGVAYGGKKYYQARKAKKEEKVEEQESPES